MAYTHRLVKTNNKRGFALKALEFEMVRQMTVIKEFGNLYFFFEVK